MATWYIFVKDDLAARLIRRETARQYAYEDRIASLRQEIDRLSSRQLLDQDSVEYRLGELVNRQSQLESRQSIVSNLNDAFGPPAASPVVTRTIEPGKPVPAALGFAPIQITKPQPLPETPPASEPGRATTSATSGWKSSLAPTPPVDNLLARVADSLDKVEKAQIGVLRDIETSVVTQHGALRSVISDVGLDLDRMAVATPPRAQGGPYIPVGLDPKTGQFEATLSRIQPKLHQLDRLKTVVVALPLRRPMPSGAEQTSGFGVRLDPFTRAPALHSGLDFRGEYGSPVRATGAGRVVTAEYNGGYGNMVEIDHGNGLTTRYAHMSAISVAEGQNVAAGAIVGRLGSTGRSTGPHLHYETRINGEAIDPVRFVKAGQKLMARAPDLLDPPTRRKVKQAAAD